jgi:cytochrome c
MELKEKESAIPFDPLLVSKGKKVFKKCKSCHQIGDGAKNRSGPLLTGIVGKPVGSVSGFKYSKAFKKAKNDGVVWTEEELSKFLAKPKAYLKGTKMAFAGLKKEKDSDAIIEYLKSFSDK